MGPFEHARRDWPGYRGRLACSGLTSDFHDFDTRNIFIAPNVVADDPDQREVVLLTETPLLVQKSRTQVELSRKTIFRPFLASSVLRSFWAPTPQR